MDSQLLDCLTLNNGKELFGIVDYITTKHVYFFDFAHLESPNYVLLAAMWRSDHSLGDIRFSVYSIIEFPELPLPRAVLVPKANIKSSSIILTPTKKSKNTKVKAQETLLADED